MRFTPIDIPDTVMAYKVTDNGKDLGLVWLSDLYWHGRKAGKTEPVHGGDGFVRARGYESKNAAALALAR